MDPDTLANRLLDAYMRHGGVWSETYHRMVTRILRDARQISRASDRLTSNRILERVRAFSDHEETPA